MNLRDPIAIKVALKGTRSDQDGAWTVTLSIPASEAVKAAQLSLMRGIVFNAVFTPEDVSESGEPKL